MTSATTLAASAKTIATAHAEYARKAFKDASEFISKLTSLKSPDEAMKLQAAGVMVRKTSPRARRAYRVDRWKSTVGMTTPSIGIYFSRGQPPYRPSHVVQNAARAELIDFHKCGLAPRNRSTNQMPKSQETR